MKKSTFFLFVGFSTLLLASCQKKGNEPPSTDESNKSTSTSSSALSESYTSEGPQPTYNAGELLVAVGNRDIQLARSILKDTTFVIDEKSTNGDTPLNLAVQQNNIEMAKLLIDYGANINSQNSIQDSPYLYAGAEGRTEILAYILEHAQPQPDQKIVNRYGGNALIPAAEKGHIDNVTLLLKDGRADINWQNNFGYTALIEAVALKDGSKRFQEIVQLLVENGAKTNLKDNSGRTALDYARQKNYKEMISILQK